MGLKRWVFLPRFLWGSYSIRIIYCYWFFFLVYSQSDLFPSLVSLHYSYSNKSLAYESILNEDIFSLNTSVTHNQEFIKLKMLILTFIFACETNIRISQQKVDFNFNKKYLSAVDSQLVWGVLLSFSF